MVRLPVWLTRIESDSMEPTLRDGQLVWTRALWGTERILRGDLVAVDSVEVGRRIVKRVVGLPGERVDLRYGRVFIDGAPLEERYASASNFTGTFDVPHGHYLLLGDNRDASIDSRSWDQPYLSRDQLVGRLRHPQGAESEPGRQRGSRRSSRVPRRSSHYSRENDLPE